MLFVHLQYHLASSFEISWGQIFKRICQIQRNLFLDQRKGNCYSVVGQCEKSIANFVSKSECCNGLGKSWGQSCEKCDEGNGVFNFKMTQNLTPSKAVFLKFENQSGACRKTLVGKILFHAFETLKVITSFSTASIRIELDGANMNFRLNG